MFCKNCGKEIEKNEKFCAKCGTEQSTEDTGSKINFASNSTWTVQTTGVKIAVYIALALVGLIIVSMIILYIPSLWR